jgi:hypothetical protein
LSHCQNVQVAVGLGDGGEQVAGLTVWPIPASDVLHVSGRGRLELELQDAAGRVVWAKHVNRRSWELEIPVLQLPDGVYLLRAGSTTQRISVIH